MLPDIDGVDLLIEAINMGLWLVDRELMLRKVEHLRRSAGFDSIGDRIAIDLLRAQLGSLNVPIFDGLPLGHGNRRSIALTGAMTELAAQRRTVTLVA